MLTQHIQDILQVSPSPFPNFSGWDGPGNEASIMALEFEMLELLEYSISMCDWELDWN